MRSCLWDMSSPDGEEAESLFERVARVIEESARLRDEVQRSLARATLQSARLIRSSEGLRSPPPVSDSPGYRVLRPPPPRDDAVHAEAARRAGRGSGAAWRTIPPAFDAPSALFFG